VIVFIAYMVFDGVWLYVFGHSAWSFGLMMAVGLVLGLLFDYFLNEKVSEHHTVGEYWEDEPSEST
jgi:hypothetical protein